MAMTESETEAAALSLLSIGPSAGLVSAILSSSAMTSWQNRFYYSNHQIGSGPKASSWLLTTLVIAANVTWWVLASQSLKGNDAIGVTMGMVGIVIGTPIISTINNWLVRPYWEKKLLATLPQE